MRMEGHFIVYLSILGSCYPTLDAKLFEDAGHIGTYLHLYAATLFSLKVLIHYDKEKRLYAGVCWK